MFAQLGSIIFQGLFAPDSIGFDGDEATYAQHELINGKPRIQSTGSTLQELSLSIKLNANFCNPEEQLQALRNARDTHEILPLLMGDGRYVNDYVLTSCNPKINEVFPDGTVIEYQVDISLLEHVAFSKLEQKQQAARKKAFAVGNKTPVVSTTQQPKSALQGVAQGLTETTTEADKIDVLVSDYQNNPSNRTITGNRIKETCLKAEASLKASMNALDGIVALKEKSTTLRLESQAFERAINNLKAVVPPSNMNDLLKAQLSLTAVKRKFKKAATPLFTDMILRKA